MKDKTYCYQKSNMIPIHILCVLLDSTSKKKKGKRNIFSLFYIKEKVNLEKVTVVKGKATSVLISSSSSKLD